MHAHTTGYIVSSERRLTRRGVVWLGQTCNLRCHFCYFQQRIAAKDHPEHPFMTLDKAKAICDTLVDVYANTAIDIQGGEPTIYPAIHELVAHCRERGLLPSLITNALILDKREACRKLRDAGVRDLLVSVHGLGETYDRAVGVPGAHARQRAAIGLLAEEGVPMRFNCVLAKSVLPQLVDVCRLAVEVGARVVNFLAFNPFEDQTQGRVMQDVPTYAEIVPRLREALDLLAEAGVEANVRYLPLCLLPEAYRKHFYNFQQLPYDSHEWDYASWSWTAQNPQRRRDGELSPTLSLREANTRSRLFGTPGYLEDDSISRKDAYRHSALIRAREHCGYRYAAQCGECGVQAICDGIHGDYANIIGTHEAAAVATSAPVTDPLFYIARQLKIEETEDRS